MRKHEHFRFDSAPIYLSRLRESSKSKPTRLKKMYYGKLSENGKRFDRANERFPIA